MKEGIVTLPSKKSIKSITRTVISTSFQPNTDFSSSSGHWSWMSGFLRVLYWFAEPLFVFVCWFKAVDRRYEERLQVLGQALHFNERSWEESDSQKNV